MKQKKSLSKQEEKIFIDFVCSRLSLEELTKKYNLSKREIVDLIRTYIFNRRTAFTKRARQVLEQKLVMDFYNSYSTTPKYAEEMGYELSPFLRIIERVVAKVPSDTLACDIYAKTLAHVRPLVQNFPKRVVLSIGKTYAYTDYCVDHLASIYNVTHCTITAVFKRGISENIYDDDLADAVFSKVFVPNNNVYRRRNTKTYDSYEAAFKKRDITKLQEEQTQLELLLESEEPVNYTLVQQKLEKIIKQISNLQ